MVAAGEGSGERDGGSRPPDLWLLASHDFRQPAQALGTLAAALAGTCSDEQRRSIAARMSHVAGVLDHMIELMTRVARLEAGTQRPPLRPYDLTAALPSIAHDLAPIFDRHRRSVRLSVADADAGAVAAPDMLPQMLTGLLLAAVQHARDDEIAVTTRAHPSGIAIEVAYLGAMPPRALEQQAFVEMPPAPGEDAPSAPVVVLGLALVARLARLYDGTLTHAGEHGDRQRLTMLLPRATAWRAFPATGLANRGASA